MLMMQYDAMNPGDQYWGDEKAENKTHLLTMTLIGVMLSQYVLDIHEVLQLLTFVYRSIKI